MGLSDLEELPHSIKRKASDGDIFVLWIHNFLLTSMTLILIDAPKGETMKGNSKQNKALHASLVLPLLAVTTISILWVITIGGEMSAYLSPSSVYGLVNFVEEASIEPMHKYPNATAMQWHDDKKRLEKHNLFNFPSRTLGSPCQQEHQFRNECSKFSFPQYKGNSFEGGDQSTLPDECWPRLAIIASYPTSGSFMARMLFSLSTGLATGKKSCQETIFNWGEWNELGLDAGPLCDSNLQLPYAGRVALVKTHKRPERHNIFIKNGVLDKTTGNVLPSHIVRLVRNPGDHMLREASRMHSDSKTNLDYEEFRKRAKSVCDEVMDKHVPKFNFFHQKWQEASEHIPSIMLHYEEMTDPDMVGKRMNEIIDFVGEKRIFDVDYTEAVRRPSYEQGTLFKEMCGIEMARELHKKTKKVSDLIGYDFDWEEGVWSMRIKSNLRDPDAAWFSSVIENLLRFSGFDYESDIDRIEASSDTGSYPGESNTTSLLQPNPTAMQVHNDERKIEGKGVNTIRSNILGSPCQKSSSEIEWKKPNDAENADLFDVHHDCSKLRFPLSKASNSSVSHVEECWPRLSIIASYPTSGNFMARMLFSLSTGVSTGTLGASGRKGLVYDWGAGNVFKAQGPFCELNLQLPYGDRVALLKTHKGPNFHNIFIENGVIDKSAGFEVPSSIVRLVRNPGDHMLRQASRMYSDSKTNLDHDNFEDKAKSICEEVINVQVPSFVNFHKKWHLASKHIPSIMLHYEEMTDPDVVGKRMDEIVDFVGETRVFDFNFNKIVRRPSYEQGTLFKEMCGIAMARQVHCKTKNVSDITGYDFDWEEGVWRMRTKSSSSKTATTDRCD